MPQMQLLTGSIHVKGGNQTVVRDQFKPLTPAEITVLQVIHEDEGAVTDLVEIGRVERTIDEELDRLERARYPGKVLKQAFPGVGPSRVFPFEFGGIPVETPASRPEPDIHTQKIKIANRILELGGEPPHTGRPLKDFNKVLADLMQEDLGDRDEAAQAAAEGAASERAEKRILRAEIKSRGGTIPEGDPTLDELEDALAEAMKPKRGRPKKEPEDA